jgi:predicted nucleic-acid-binding protein
MIGRDTNVLVRYIMQDDPVQSPKAAELIESLTSDNPRLHRQGVGGGVVLGADVRV